MCCGDAVDEDKLVLCCALCCINCSCYNACDCAGCSGKVCVLCWLVDIIFLSSYKRKNDRFLFFYVTIFVLIFHLFFFFFPIQIFCMVFSIFCINTINRVVFQVNWIYKSMLRPVAQHHYNPCKYKRNNENKKSGFKVYKTHSHAEKIK